MLPSFLPGKWEWEWGEQSPWSNAAENHDEGQSFWSASLLQTLGVLLTLWSQWQQIQPCKLCPSLPEETGKVWRHAKRKALGSLPWK